MSCFQAVKLRLREGMDPCQLHAQGAPVGRVWRVFTTQRGTLSEGALQAKPRLWCFEI